MATVAATFRPPPSTPRREPVRRTLGRLGASLGTLVLFILAVVLGVVLHANTPVARRLAMTEVDALLAPSFKGRIRVQRLDGLSLLGVRGADVTIDDPTGSPVLVARGVRARVATFAAARSAFLGNHGPLTVELSDVAIDTIDVRLDTDAGGQLDLVTAFAPRTPAPATPASPGARGFRLVARHVAWRHAWAHGRMTGAPPIDADVDELRGDFTYAPDGMKGDVAGAKVVARGIANGADVVGLLRAGVVAPSAPGAPLDARLRWEGIAGGIQHSVTASMANDRVDAVVDAPAIDSAGIRALWHESPIEAPGSLHAEAHGDLADVDLAVRARLGPGNLDVRGHASLRGEKTAEVTLDARDIDVHPIVASAPRTRVGLTGTASAARKADGALTGSMDLQFLGGSVGKIPVPPMSIHGAGALSATRQLTGTASVVVEEPGTSTKLDVEVSPRGRSSAVDFALRAASMDLGGVSELRHALRGSARVAADGELDLGTMAIDAHVQVTAEGVAQGTSGVASASLRGSVEGPLADPRIDATLRGLGIQVGGVRFDSVYLGARGGMTAAQVTATARGPDTPDVDAHADVALESGVTVGRLRMTLTRPGALAVVTAREIEVGSGDLRVEDGRIEGLGGPVTATVAMTPRTMRVRAAAQGVDLARVACLGHLERSVKAGLLSFDTDLRLERERGEGRATLDLKGASLGAVKGVSGHADAALNARRLACGIHAAAEGIGAIDVQAPAIELASGSLTSAASWKQAWGAVDVDANADLSRLDTLVPPEQSPVGRAHGKLHLKAHLARDDAHDFTPDVTVSVKTDQLGFAAWAPVSRDIDGVTVYAVPAWNVEGIDFDLDARIDGDTGASRVTAEARDARGPLARLDLSSSHLPFAEAIEESSKLAASLRTTPFDAHVVVPERALGSVPAILRQSYVTGRLQADVRASGTLLSPVVNLTAALRRAHYAEKGVRGRPLDLDVTARYDGKRGTASVKARNDDRELLDLEAQGEAAVAQLLDASSGTGEAGPAWKASARAHLSGFPLSSIAVLNDKLVSGGVSGDVTLVDLHSDAHADASLAIDALTVGTFAYKSATLQLKADGRTLDGAVRIDQTDGFLETKAHAVASWGAALVPALDRVQPMNVDLSAKNFRVAVLLPLLDGALDELDGRLDAETRLQLDPTRNRTRVSGTLALSRGTMEAAADGGELHDITASVKLDGDGAVTLEKLTANGRTGHVEVTGTAKLDGTSLQSANAVVVIPGNAAIPLSASGTEIGNVDGRIELSELTSSSGAMAVKVEIPRLRVALPEGSTTHARALGPMAKVRIGAHRGDPSRFVLVPLDPVRKERAPSKSAPSPVTLETHFGDVLVVRGTELKVDLDGTVHVVGSGDTPTVRGQIRLKRGGTLDVQGRKFEIEQGTVTLVGPDPSDPEVVLEAGWTAPDGTVVHATFDGPLKTGKVTLSSEPTLPQQEIVQLLLFGTADGTQAQSSLGAPQNAAIGTAGGEAAQPLNHMLGQLGLGAVTANVDTTQAANPRPEVEVQIARDISVQIAVVLGQPPPGVNPDHTLLTVDWRFFSKWSLASTVGDAGTTIFDLLWQRRY